MFENLRKPGVRIIKGLGVVALGYTLSGCSVDAADLLDQKCSSGDTVVVSGVPVAEAEFLLPKGSELRVDDATVVSIGNGEFGIVSIYQVTLLSDGRMVLEYDRAVWEVNQKVAITGVNDGGKTRVTLTTNCKDVSKTPPDIRNRNGFSPLKRGTGPAPGSYRGFGHR